MAFLDDSGRLDDKKTAPDHYSKSELLAKPPVEGEQKLEHEASWESDGTPSLDDATSSHENVNSWTTWLLRRVAYVI